MSPALHRRSLFVLLLSLCLPCGPAIAREPRSPSPQAAQSASDTSRSVLRRLRPYMSGGVSWITAPESSRQHSEAGMLFEGGLQATPRRLLRLRLGVDYLWLPIHTLVTGVLLQGTDPAGNPTGTAFSGDQTGTGSVFGLRLEPQLKVLPGTWLLAGGGVSHFSTTNPSAFKAGTVYSAIHGGPAVLVTRTDGPDVSRWAGSWTLGLRHDFRFMNPPLGLELRWSAVGTGADALHMASVRIGR